MFFYIKIDFEVLWDDIQLCVADISWGTGAGKWRQT